MSERNATTTHTTVDRFAVYDIPDTQVGCMHFESTGDLRGVIHTSRLSDTGRFDPAEQDVLIRLNVDDEDMAIVYVDSPAGLDDAGTIDRAIEMLEVARDQLYAMPGRPATP